MKLFYHVLNVYILLLLFSKEGMALKCYQCHSELHNCKSSRQFLKECVTPNVTKDYQYMQPYCRYLEQSIQLDDVPDLIIQIRECAFLHNKEATYLRKFKEYPYFRTYAKLCNKDACNSVVRWRHGAHTYVLSFLVLLVDLLLMYPT